MIDSHVPSPHRFQTSLWARCAGLTRIATGATSSTIGASRTFWGRSTQTAGRSPQKTTPTWAFWNLLISNAAVLFVLIILHNKVNTICIRSVGPVLPQTPLLSLSDAINERCVYLAAVPHREDPDGGRGEQHHGVSAQHQLTSLRSAHPVSAPVPPQPGQWEGQDAKVCLFFLYKCENIIGCIMQCWTSLIFFIFCWIWEVSTEV